MKRFFEHVDKGIDVFERSSELEDFRTINGNIWAYIRQMDQLGYPLRVYIFLNYEKELLLIQSRYYRYVPNGERKLSKWIGARRLFKLCPSIFPKVFPQHDRFIIGKMFYQREIWSSSRYGCHWLCYPLVQFSGELFHVLVIWYV